MFTQVEILAAWHGLFETSKAKQPIIVKWSFEILTKSQIVCPSGKVYCNLMKVQRWLEQQLILLLVYYSTVGQLVQIWCTVPTRVI